MPRRWASAALQLTELFVSALVHMLYGFYIFSSAVAGDLSQTLSDWFFKPNMNLLVKEQQQSLNESSSKLTNVEDLPPIVLVHGIFGFGKGVRWRFSPKLIILRQSIDF